MRARIQGVHTVVYGLPEPRDNPTFLIRVDSSDSRRDVEVKFESSKLDEAGRVVETVFELVQALQAEAIGFRWIRFVNERKQ